MKIHRNFNVKIKTSVNSEFFFSVLFVLFWIKDTTFPFIIQIFKRIPIIGGFYEYLYSSLTVVLLIFSFKYFLYRVKINDIILYVIGMLTIILTAFFLKENAFYIDERIYKILVSAMMMYFIGLGFSYEKLKNLLFYVSLINLVAVWLYQLYLLGTGRILVADNMDASYKILPSIIFLIHWMFVRFNVVNLIIGIAAFLLSLLFGTRGPILIILLVCIACVFFKVVINKSFYKRVFYSSICIIVAILLLNGNFIVDVATRLLEIFKARGFSTRILEMFLEGDISYMTDRDMLSIRIIEAIKEQPLWGYGFMGDRVILGRYTHNIFLEMWCDFGVVVGTVLIAALLITFINSLIKNKGTDGFYLLLSMFIMILVKLSLSGTFVTEQYFYLILGISVAMIRSGKKNDSKGKFRLKLKNVGI